MDLKELILPIKNYFTLKENCKNNNSKDLIDMAYKISVKNIEILYNELCEGNPANSKPANCAIFDVSQRSELLAFKQFISKTPQAELEYYSDEEFTDLYLKANCG
jgi:hypothetical protein